MDLRAYYQKIRDVEATIAEEFAIVVSPEGTRTEVTRRLAAKLIVESLARLASAEEVKAYRAVVAEARRVAEQVAQAAKVQFTVLSNTELERLKGHSRAAKD